MRIIDKIVDNSFSLVPFVSFANEYYTFHKTTGTPWINYFENARTNLINLAALKRNGKQKSLLNDIVDDFESIIKATPSEIPKIITKYTSGQYTNTLHSKPFRKQIETAFNYKAFRKSAKASWFAERFEIKACLYCNAQFTLAIGKDGVKKKLLFQLDHFYSKSDLPFLSLTLGNLIPTCSSCNISKSKIPFASSTHIHPYEEDTNIMFDFFIDENQALEFLLGDRDYKLLTPQIRVLDPKFSEHRRIFNIDAIYNKHTDVVEELVLKSLYYNKSKRDELINEFSDLKLSKSIIDRFVLGNYSLDSEINKRPLAKLSKDIGKQLKIIK